MEWFLAVDWPQFWTTLLAFAALQGLCRWLNGPRQIHHTHLVFPKANSLSIEVKEAQIRKKSD